MKAIMEIIDQHIEESECAWTAEKLSGNTYKEAICGHVLAELRGLKSEIEASLFSKEDGETFEDAIVAASAGKQNERK